MGSPFHCNEIDGGAPDNCAFVEGAEATAARSAPTASGQMSPVGSAEIRQRAVPYRGRYGLVFSSLACSAMNDRISSAMSSSLVHCSLYSVIGKPPEPVDRDAALLAHLHRDPARRSLLERFVLLPQTLELRSQIFIRHCPYLVAAGE